MRGLVIHKDLDAVGPHLKRRAFAKDWIGKAANPTFERVQLVRRLLRARAERGNHLSARLFSEPAWDMLLELYLAFLVQRRLSVTDVCGGSRVPPTTALRWIDALKAEDLIVRQRDPFDGRRIFVELTPKGSGALQQYFDAISHRVWPIESQLQQSSAL